MEALLVLLGGLIMLLSLRWLLSAHLGYARQHSERRACSLNAASHLRGGGGDDEYQMEQHALLVAQRIRSELGEKVNKPGLAAIKAVLLMRRKDSITQRDVMKRFPTTKDSLRKYRALIGKLAPDATAVDQLSPERQPTPAQQQQQQQLALLQQHLHVQGSWVAKHVPDILSFRAGPLVLADGFATRALEATVLCPLDEETESTLTGEVTYNLPALGESAAEARRRADRHRRREEALLRSFDDVSIAEHHASDNARHRVSRAFTAEVRQALNALIDDVCARVEIVEKAEPLVIQSTLHGWLQKPDNAYYIGSGEHAEMETRVDDLLWIQPIEDPSNPGFLPSYQLAVLKRIKSGERVDVQLCDPIPPDHGGCERVTMRRWRFNLPTTAIIGPVIPISPLAYADFCSHANFRKQRWTWGDPPITTAGLQLWRAARLTQGLQDVSRRRAYVRRVHGLRDEFGALVSIPKLKETRKALNECHRSERRQFFCEPPSSVPLLSELALQAVPECLLWTHLKSGPFPPMVDKSMTRSQMLQEMQLEARRARRELEMCPPAAPPSPQVDYGYDSDTMLSDVSFNENEGEESDGSSESMSY